MSQFTVDVISWMQGTFGQTSAFLDFFSTWGGPTGWLFVVSLVFWLGGSTMGLRVGFATSIASITNPPLKWAIAEARPYYVTDAVEALKASDGFGMSSGHAQGVAGQWSAIGYWVGRWWAVALAATFIVCTGAARVYYDVHSPFQVLVGWSIGLLAVVATVRLERPVVAWCRRRSGLAQVTAAVTAGALLVVLGLWA
jgi:membrane-associated phospholipid phosphatase